MRFESIHKVTGMCLRSILLITFLFKKAALRIDASSETSPTTTVASVSEELRVFSQVNIMIYNRSRMFSLGMKNWTDGMLLHI
jgi:hypothetical protein